MKKIGLIFLVIFVCFQTYAQKTVYGKYKNKSVKLVYFEGDPDIIKSIEYERVGDLEKENANLQSQIALKNKKITELQNAGTGGVPILNKAQTDSLNLVIKKLQTDKDKLSADIKSNNLEISKLKGSILPLNDSLTLANSVKKGLYIKLFDLETKNNNLTNQITEKNKKIKELQDAAVKPDANKVQIDALNKQIEQLQTDKNKLTADIKSNNLEINKLRGSVQPLNDSLAQANIVKKGLYLKLNDLETKNSNLTSQITEKNKKIKELQEGTVKPDANKVQIDALNKQIEQIQTDKDKLSADIKSNNLEISKLKGSIQPLNDSLTLANSVKKGLYIKLFDLETKNSNLTSQITEKNKKIKELQEGTGKPDANKGIIDDLNKQIEQLQTDKDKLSADVKSNNLEISKIRGSIQSLNDSLAKANLAKKSLYLKVSDLESQIVEKNKKIKELQGNKVKPDANKEQIDALNKEIEKLTTEKDDLSAEIKSKNIEINRLKETIQPLSDSLTQSNQEVKLLQEKLKHPAINNYKSAPSLAVSYATGIPFLFSNLLKSGIWDKNFQLSNQFGLLYEQPLGSVSIGIGLGITKYRLKASFSNYEETINDLTDVDNDTYNAICSYKDVKEDVSLLYLDIPIVLSFGQPRVNRIGAYGKIGVTASINMQSKFNGSGNYNISGYYPKWDVVIHDVSELNFSSDASCYENANYKVNKFVLWGTLSGGVYLPLSNIKQGKDARFILKLGARCDYSLLTISKQLDELYKGANYRIKQSNILSGKGTRILSPGLEVAFIFMLAKPQ